MQEKSLSSMLKTSRRIVPTIAQLALNYVRQTMKGILPTQPSTPLSLSVHSYVDNLTLKQMTSQHITP